MASAEPTLEKWRADPHYPRVGSWMDTHTRLLAYLQALRASALFASKVATAEELGALWQRVLPRLATAFDDLELLLDAHSTLEDRKLFPFLDQFGAFGRERAQFAREHEALDGAMHRVSAGLSGLRELAERAGEAQSVAELALRLQGDFVALDESMRAHFIGEETAAVPLMLSLTDEQHRTYSTFSLAKPASRL
ncbi:hypothetical protein T492DRAFT_1023472 [Pavlovales sp. CCMP2436]|nr:hypothetical protein T492DRAFT_1023472 [Pavlovales sp. CCMP2436]|mmetsp:Transcript_6844/g.17939  ORF Transcript_6844/g.17939 Transcript_6844/m.17939 type:complete len:194 (+) Transcript_6844:295-876(+)